MTTKAIIADLSVHFVRQMQNWARADAGGGGLRGGSLDSERGDIFQGLTQVPNLYGEAIEVSEALNSEALQEEHRDAVKAFWRWEGGDLIFFARMLECDTRTFERHLSYGHRALQAELHRRRDMRNRAAEAHRESLKVLSNSIISPEDYARKFSREEIDS